MEKKMLASATKELEKASLGEGSNGVVENQQRKEQRCSGLMEEHLKIYEVKFFHCRKTKDWIDKNKETRNLYHREDK